MRHGSFRAINWTLPGSCPEMARQMRRIIRQMHFGNAASGPADIRADGSRHCGGIAAGNPPKNRRTQNPSLAKGSGFHCKKCRNPVIC